ncbi:T9SS C-terminal target domain-containing protein, partial [bacterium]|nr:T9SS C-terminal target domain-containing protein [bacterium]
PCNPTTSIRFALPAARDARLDLFDVEGRRVRTLLDGFVPAGWSSVRWDGRADDGAAVPSGVYLYRLITGHEQLSGRVTLAR